MLKNPAVYQTLKLLIVDNLFLHFKNCEFNFSSEEKYGKCAMYAKNPLGSDIWTKTKDHQDIVPIYQFKGHFSFVRKYLTQPLQNTNKDLKRS